MNSSLVKSQIFTFLAFVLLMYFFVIPAVLTHNVVEIKADGEGEKISNLTTKVWNYYNKGAYKFPATFLGIVGDL